MPVPCGQPVWRHEAIDHAMEHDAVVEALARELLDARHVAGCQVGAKRDHDAALRRLDDQGVLGICDVSHLRKLQWMSEWKRERDGLRKGSVASERQRL